MAWMMVPMRRVEHLARRRIRLDFSCPKTLAGSPQSGVIVVELLVMLGLFAVMVGGSDGGAGALAGPVGGDEDLPGQARLDRAVGACCGQIVVRPGVRTREARAGFRPPVR